MILTIMMPSKYEFSEGKNYIEFLYLPTVNKVTIVPSSSFSFQYIVVIFIPIVDGCSMGR
jgi:hypothetical protein